MLCGLAWGSLGDPRPCQSAVLGLATCSTWAEVSEVDRVLMTGAIPRLTRLTRRLLVTGSGALPL